MLGAFRIEPRGGTVDAVGVADRHDRRAGAFAGQIGAAVRDAVPGFHVLDRAKLRLQGHGGFEPVLGRRTHGRVGLVTVQADTGTGQFEADLGTVQCGRRVGQMPDLRGDAGLFHQFGERVEVLDLPIGGSHEFRHIGGVGHSQMAPLPHHAHQPLLGQRNEPGHGVGEVHLGETVAAESGIDLDVDTRGASSGASGRGDRFDAVEGADRHVDVVGDQLVQRRGGAAVHPGQDSATVQSDAGFAQQQRLTGLRGAQPGGAAGERGERGRDQPMPVGVGLDHAHDGSAGFGSAAHLDQMPHVVAQCGEVHNRLRRVFPERPFVVRLTLLAGKPPLRCCTQCHGLHCVPLR